MMLVVGRRRDETIGAAGSAVVDTAVAVGFGIIPMSSSIETRGEGVGIAGRGVVDTRVIGKPARVVSRIYSIHAARQDIPSGESGGGSSEHEGRRECNLGLVQHCCISL